MRLPIFFSFRENPPTGFRQMPRHGHGRFAVALGLETLIELHHVLLAVALPVHDHAVGCLYEGPAEIVIGLLGGRTIMASSAAGVHRGYQSSVAGQVPGASETLHVANLDR